MVPVIGEFWKPRCPVFTAAPLIVAVVYTAPKPMCGLRSRELLIDDPSLTDTALPHIGQAVLSGVAEQLFTTHGAEETSTVVEVLGYVGDGFESISVPAGKRLKDFRPSGRGSVSC